MPTPRQRADRLRAQAVRARTADAEAAEARIAGYIPGDPAADPHLPVIRLLARTARPADAADAAELLTVLAGHAASLDRSGVNVDADTLVDPARVRHWVLTGLTGHAAGTTANYRSRLTRVAHAHHGTSPDRDTPLHGSPPAEHYTVDDEDDLIRWADGLGPPGLRDDLTAAVSLLLGTGLTASEAMAVTGRDVLHTPDRDTWRDGQTDVRVTGPRPRTVPVRARYAAALCLAALRVGPDGWLVRPRAAGRGGRNGLSNLVDTALAASAGVPRLTPQRTRATWVVRHLEAGTRADLLIAAAGVDSLAALARYVPHMCAPTPAQRDAVRLDGGLR